MVWGASQREETPHSGLKSPNGGDRDGAWSWLERALRVGSGLGPGFLRRHESVQVCCVDL